MPEPLNSMPSLARSAYPGRQFEASSNDQSPDRDTDTGLRGNVSSITGVPDGYGTTVSGPSHASQRLDTVLEISSFVLTTLRDVASLSPVPFLKESAALALGILDSVQQAKGNKGLFKRLADDTCSLIYSVAIIYAEREREGGQMAADLNNDIGGLVSTLTSIDKFTRKQASRNFFSRMGFAKRDAGRVQEYRERLRQSLDVFWLQSSIHVRESLSQIAKQQGVMYQALQDRQSGDVVGGRPSAEYVSGGQQDRLEVLSATRYNNYIFNNARGPGNGNTFGTHNNVAGNQINNHNSTQTTSKSIQAITSGSGGQGGPGQHHGGAGGAGGNITLSM